MPNKLISKVQSGAQPNFLVDCQVCRRRYYICLSNTLGIPITESGVARTLFPITNESIFATLAPPA